MIFNINKFYNRKIIYLINILNNYHIMSINYLSFNNICTNLTCSTDQGYIVYGLSPNLEKKLFMDMEGGVGVMNMFKKSNIVILVGGGTKPFKSKDTLLLWDQLSKQTLLEIDMKEPINNVLITKDHIIVVLEKKICLYTWAASLIDTKITYSNEKGLCAINMKLNTIATLGTKKGEISIWKPENDTYKTIQAHNTNIEAITISNDGNLVATASEKGTLIRVFDTRKCELKHEFRRGAMGTNIYDICFNHSCTLLACTSANSTIHIFDICDNPDNTKNTTSYLSSIKGFLPKYFSSQWGFRQINIDDGSKSVCIFDENNDLHIATYNGKYYKIIGKNNDFNTIVDGELHINNK